MLELDGVRWSKLELEGLGWSQHQQRRGWSQCVQEHTLGENKCGE